MLQVNNMRERKRIRIEAVSIVEFNNVLQSYYDRNIIVTGSYINISNKDNKDYPEGTGYIEVVVEDGNKVCYYSADEDEYRDKGRKI